MRYIDAAEDPSEYRPGGFHPTHLGDTFSNGRYTIVHKLGYGSSSTVWLVDDTHTGSYAALKIVVSELDGATELAILRHLVETYDAEEEGGRYVARMLDHFVHEGPNGKHLCIVTDVQGPHIAAETLRFFFGAYNGVMSADIARRLSGQIALGVAYLHKRGIAHGDLHAGNILFCFPHPWTSLEEIERDLGTPRKKDFKPTPEEAASPHLPKYLVPSTAMFYKADLLRKCLQKPNIRICDFSGSYMPNLPHPSPLAVPHMFRPPQAILGEVPHATLELDIWALAVLFHVLFAGFGLFLERGDDLLADMAFNLGPFPKPYWCKWENRAQYFDASGKRMDPSWETTFLKVECSMPQGRKERRAFEALLRCMTTYDPGKRISAQRVADDAWITEFCRPFMGCNVEYTVEYLSSDDSEG
ncbi:Protein kinase [Mycena kentingensis (nom. inval.)]|nr:Protein kinase [Mycena kentingensis (nom. inval.)]